MRLPHYGLILLLLLVGLQAGENIGPQLKLEGKAELFRRDVVSTGRTEIRITLSPDGNRMLWGSIGPAGDPRGWEILESVQTPSGWSEPRPVSFNTPANEFDPSFAPDGSGVYFFSNRPGGLGGDDLYFVPFDAKAKSYGAARNLGPTVNSTGDEWAPVVSPDGKRLLFATDGRGGQGRHDLFVSRRGPDGTWQQSEPVTELNTPAEDFDATFLHDGHSVVFSRGKLDGRVALYWAPWTGEHYGACTALSDEVNTPGAEAFTNGPSIAATEPGWLYFSAYRANGAGRMDIYRIRYQLVPAVAPAAPSVSGTRN